MSSKSPSQTLPVFVFPNRIDFIIDTTQYHKQVFTVHNPYDFPTKYKLLTTQRNRYKVIQREGVINEKHCTDVLIRLHNDVFLQNEEEKLKKSNLEKNAPEAAFYLENKSSTANKKYFSRDKLRFEMSDMSSSHSRPLGYKDVECYIWRTKNDYLEFSSETGLSHADKNIIQDSGNIFVNNLHNSNDSDNDTISSKYKPKSKPKSKHLNRYNGSIWVPAIAMIICLVVLSIPKLETSTPTLDNIEEENENHWLLPNCLLLKSSENQRLIASYVLGILTMILVQYQQT